MNNIYYVYMYLRENGTPYYIGKGSSDRAYSKKRSTNKPINKENIRFIIENISEDEAFMWEEFWIDFFGRKDLGTGCLRNLTSGGEGSSGAILGPKPESVKQKIANTLKGKKHSEERKKNISNAHKGINRSEESKLKQSNTNMGHNVSEETRRKISEGNRGKELTNEHKQYLSSLYKGKTYESLHGEEKAKELKQKKKEAALALPLLECPHCYKIGKGGAMSLWHFDNCKLK